ncbi:MAG: NAD+ synthase [Phycisphaerae bacterium]|nr:NAD+ synthase [Phycisphaerae bacterium]
MRIALAQLNPIVGDLDGNTRRILAAIEESRGHGADLVVFPELVLLGYPPKDLLLKPHFIRRSQDALRQIASAARGVTALVGFAEPNPGPTGRSLFNAVAVCRDGRVVATHQKTLLPTYDVFDESRYFEPGARRAIETISDADGRAVRVGISICEDMWVDPALLPRSLYATDPAAELAQAGAELIINVSASPFVAGKDALRHELIRHHATRHGVPIVYVNQVGGNDDLVFDGASEVVHPAHGVVARARAFEEDLRVVDPWTAPRGDDVLAYPDTLSSIYQALVLGTRDYVRKCGFSGVVLGLSGGIDSALTAVIAVDALGPGAVHGVAMPSRFSSDHSLADGRQLAKNLGIDFRIISIDSVHAQMEAGLRETFAGREPDIAEENIQARIRGNILMALSNKFGWLLLTTGNKSELAVGYCTLYGDMCGGLAVISDVPKTTVYELARWVNARGETPRIPERSIEKPPSAELRPNQTDQDTLPPYPILDAILKCYIEDLQSADEIVSAGFDPATVRDVIRKVDLNEYKRKQAAVGLKVTSRAFGSGRRMPIAARYVQ